MHLSTHTWMRAEPLEVTLRRLRRYGYESVEISGEPQQYDVAEVRTLLKKYGIRCWGSVTLTGGTRNLASRDPKVRAATVTYMKDVVSFAAALGGEIVSLVPANVGNIRPEGSPEEEWRWILEGCQEIYAHARPLGIRLGIEPLNRFETHIINRADQALAMAKAVGRDCGVCLDVFHLNIEETDMHAAFEAVGSRLVDVHVADNNRMAAGQGAFDWKKIVRTLRKIGYRGALTVEFVAPVDRTPVNRYKKSLESAPEGMSPEQLAFIQDHGSAVFTDAFYTMLVRTSAETLLPLIGRR